MPFDSLVLSGVASELRTTLTGGHVQKIYQPKELEVHLIIRAHGKNHRLLLSADARFSRICLTLSAPENPQTPPQFCMALRKHLEGSHLVEVAQVDFDRILHLDFQYGDGTRKRLVVEMMGQHSNIILLDAGGLIVDAVKRIPRRLSRLREVLPGRHYAAPPTGERRDPVEADPAVLQPPPAEQMTGWLQERFHGMSRWLAGEIAARAEASGFVEAWSDVFNRVIENRLEPTLLLDELNKPIDYFGLHSIQFPAARQRRALSMNHAVDQVAERLSVSTSLEQARQSLLRAISTILKSSETRRQDALKGLAEADRIDDYRIRGELILTNLHSIRKGQSEVEVLNYYDPEVKLLNIQLDPKLTPQENAEVYFRKQRKAREGQEEHRKRLEKLDEQIYDLKAAQIESAGLTELVQIEELRQRLMQQNLLPRQQAPVERERKEALPPGIRRVTTPEGWEVLVGENAVANDYITTKMASPSDLWFHARAIAGSHVVLRTGGKALGDIPPAVIREAARLAAVGSEARHSSIVPVDYTRKRYVRKPRGSAPGNVLYQNEKTIHVELKTSQQHSNQHDS